MEYVLTWALVFCTIKRGEEYRDFDTNDFVLNQDVFIPVHLRQEVFSFVQNNVVTKEEGIGRKTTGDGMIALTNWHLFENQLADDDQQEEGGAYWYKARVEMITIDGEKETRKNVAMLVQANQADDALFALKQAIKSYDSEIISIAKTNIMDILHAVH